MALKLAFKLATVLERYETKGFASKQFNSVWINTDKMIYYLNNVRKRGYGGKRYDDTEEKLFQTHVVVSGDVNSRYIFRSDVAYDWNVTLEDIENDTKDGQRLTPAQRIELTNKKFSMKDIIYFK